MTQQPLVKKIGMGNTNYINDNDTLPVFPLPNTILFPGISIPLHIFEPRYRQMIKDCLDGKGVICLATISEKWQGINEGDFEFYPFGIACRIVNYNALEDGRYNIILKGLERCELQNCEYRKSKLYRTVQIKIRENDLKTPMNRSIENELRQIAANFFKTQPTSSSESEINEHFAKMEIMQIINILCMNAPISITNKHAIFAKETLTEICDSLLELYATFRL